MSLTIKIFLFVLVLVQVIANEESNKTRADSSENTLVSDSSKEKEKTDDTKEESRIKKRFLPMDHKNSNSKTTTPDDVLKKPLFRNEVKLPDVNKVSTGLNKVLTKVQMFFNEIFRVFSLAKFKEIVINIKDIINNHKHIEGTPRVFSKEVPTGAARKLLSAEEDEGEPTTNGESRSEGQDETGEGKDEEKADESKKEGKRQSQKKLNRNEGPIFENLASNTMCDGENCKKVVEGQKVFQVNIPKLPKVIGSISQVKKNGIIMGITNAKVLKLIQMKRNLKSMKRALGKFETNLARFAVMTNRVNMKPSMDLSLNLDTAVRNKRFLFKLKKDKKVMLDKSNIESLRLTEKLTTSKIYHLTELLKNYNSESKRIVNDLIILLSNLKEVQKSYGDSQISPIKLLTRIPKIFAHDIPSILIGIIHDILRKIEKLKNTATGGAKSIYYFYDDIRRYLKKFNLFNKTKFLYKILARNLS